MDPSTAPKKKPAEDLSPLQGLTELVSKPAKATAGGNTCQCRYSREYQRIVQKKHRPSHLLPVFLQTFEMKI